MRLRSLDHIRYFETAARTLSFRDAAQILNVTPAAVSQRIRQMELELGVALFERHVRRVELTEEGRFLALEAGRALEICDRAIGSIVRDQRIRAVNLTTTPTFAEQILLPVLAGLHERVADRSVRVMVSTDLVDPGRDGVDLAVRQGEGRYPGYRVRKLFPCVYAPVCAPALAKDSRIAPLVHVDWPGNIHEPPTWSWWEKARGKPPFLTRGELHVPTEAMAIRSAVAGHGYALVALQHVTAEIAAGSLVLAAEAGAELETRFSYFLVEAKGSGRGPVSEVADWIFKKFS
ncbi:hypothetical protein C0V75_21805 [Tabrizicola sp. TH137]|uniref:LysR family transcriptional regulator n=1 Tax=Tabrizicola sp. TH137 TaxID=2067452 RepID=UPI000C7C6516|nr:LysR family transcriptional regulator [Tabrizicola sp. TH137]PLL10185.1 hypothetical protein C0V75_21805 [Tabrizicola sp. TH137]